jgi:hypothetical protein
MVLQILLDGGLSHSGPLFGSSESIRGGTLGTNPHQNDIDIIAIDKCDARQRRVQLHE